MTLTAFVLDISPTMGDTLYVDDDAKPGHKKETTGLELGLEYVKEKVGEKVRPRVWLLTCSSWIRAAQVLRGLKTDKVAIYVCGSERACSPLGHARLQVVSRAETNNAVAGVEDGYDNISELMPPLPASLDHEKVLRRIEVGPVPGDFLSALIVAYMAVVADVGTKKWKKEIVIVTDGMSPIDWDQGVEPVRCSTAPSWSRLIQCGRRATSSTRTRSSLLSCARQCSI
jgi:hypothetical protein